MTTQKKRSNHFVNIETVLLSLQHSQNTYKESLLFRTFQRQQRISRKFAKSPTENYSKVEI